MDRFAVGSTYSPSADWFTVHIDTRRDLLAQTVVEVRAVVAAANRDYPDQYLSDTEAKTEEEGRLQRERQRRLDADQAVIDEAMRRQPDER